MINPKIITNWLHLPKDIQIKILFYLPYEEMLRIIGLPLSKKSIKLFEPKSSFWARLIYRVFKVGISTKEIESNVYSSNLKHEYHMFDQCRYKVESCSKKYMEIIINNPKYIIGYPRHGKNEKINLKLVQSLINLSVLHIQNIDISINIFKNLPKLSSLYIWSNVQIPVHFMKSLNKLKRLRIYGNIDITNKHLTPLRNLRHVILSGETNIKIEGLKTIPKLDGLNLIKNNNIKDDDFKYLNLKRLCLINVAVSDQALKHLKNLKMLTLSGCNITDEGLKYLPELKYLSYTKTKKYGQNINIDGLKVLKSLESLSLNKVDLPINELSKLPKLKRLSLIRSKCVSEDFKSLTGLQSLEIKYCPNVDDTLFDHLPNLTQLFLTLRVGKDNITIDGLSKCYEISNLKKIIILSIYNSTEHGLRKLPISINIDELREKLKGVDININ